MFLENVKRFTYVWDLDSWPRARYEALLAPSRLTDRAGCHPPIIPDLLFTTTKNRIAPDLATLTAAYVTPASATLLLLDTFPPLQPIPG